MSEAQWSRLVEKAKDGQPVFGVHTASVADFFDKDAKEMLDAIGEPAAFERRVVLLSMYIGSILFFASIILAIVAFRWWSIIAILGGLAILSIRYAFTQLGQQRIILTIAASAVALAIALVLPVSIWSKLWLASIIFMQFLFKLRFYAAQHMLRALVARNYRAFSLLEGTAVFCSLDEGA